MNAGSSSGTSLQGASGPSFCSLMRDALEIGREPQLPYRLSNDDYHIGLAALQAGIWEAARDAHSFNADGLATRPHGNNPATVWLHHLTLWRTEVEKDGALGADYFRPAAGK